MDDWVRPRVVARQVLAFWDWRATQVARLGADDQS
jgi:hypothetical protein